jgi:glycosyltransferase involved in cell wall biosynthesis
MRIAQVSPLFESVPPKLYGGTERVVAYLTNELVRQGHDVTLFASGDSATDAKLVAVIDQALRHNPRFSDWLPHYLLMLEQVFRLKDRFDIVHFHIDYLHFPLSRREGVAQLSTLHGRLDLPDVAPLYREFRDMPVVSISNAQREPLPWVRWMGTVHHGLPLNLYRLREKPENYLAFLGRISPEKGVERAIQVAERLGMPLKIAAKVDQTDRRYFEQIKAIFDHPLVDYVGEVAQEEKQEFLGNAVALLFPIDWPEPFGLVMIEAMACGTPTIAFRRGSVPEIIQEGISGFIVDNVSEAERAVGKALSLDRKRCRHAFEQRFTAARMAGEYLSLFARLLEERFRPLRLARKSVS